MKTESPNEQVKGSNTQTPAEKQPATVDELVGFMRHLQLLAAEWIEEVRGGDYTSYAEWGIEDKAHQPLRDAVAMTGDDEFTGRLIAVFQAFVDGKAMAAALMLDRLIDEVCICLEHGRKYHEATLWTVLVKAEALLGDVKKGDVNPDVAQALAGLLKRVVEIVDLEMSHARARTGAVEAAH